MFYTYIIRSIPFPQQRYIGYTSDLKQRMEAHNYGEDKHTAPYKPWKLETYIASFAALFIRTTIDLAVHVLRCCAPKLAASWGI